MSITVVSDLADKATISTTFRASYWLQENLFNESSCRRLLSHPLFSIWVGEMSRFYRYYNHMVLIKVNREMEFFKKCYNIEVLHKAVDLEQPAA